MDYGLLNLLIIDYLVFVRYNKILLFLFSWY